MPGDALQQASGGKGANQAVAAARLGARTALIARVGADPSGDRILDRLKREGVDAKHGLRDDVRPRANEALSPDDARRARPAIANSRVLLLQLEQGVTIAVVPRPLSASRLSYLVRARHTAYPIPRRSRLVSLLDQTEPKETVVTIKRLAGTLVLSIGLIGAPSLALAQGGGATGMSGTGMGHMQHQIVIPKGALYTRADVEFMQGMIAHHSQAIVMSRMAESHGANPQVLKLSNKIDQSQVPEIRIMQNWLTRNNQFAPDTSSWHNMIMAGMLTAEQLEELDAARGVDFDRAYLQMMIQHHAGALKMVDDLFNASLAGQEVDVNVFANDVVTAQTTEIGIMQKLLTQLPAK